MSNTVVENRLRIIVVVAAVFCFLPMLFMGQDLWDGRRIFYSIRTGNLELMRTWFFETRWTLQYYLCLIFKFIEDTFGVSYKISSNILCCLSVLGIGVETNRILRDEMKMEREYRLLAVASILVFPPWATLLSSVLSFHISCVWAFLLAERWRRSIPPLAFIFFVYSLSLNSVFAFAVGYALFLGCLKIERDNWRRVGLPVFAFSAVLLVVFILYRHYFPPYGSVVGYNSFHLRVSALYNYLWLFLVLLGSAWLLTRKADPLERRRTLRLVGACCILLFFAGLAYTYVGKPIKVEGTNSFTPRQAFLTAIPMAMLVAVFARLVAERVGRKVAYGLAGALLLLSFVYQFVAYQQKYTQLYFENAVSRVFRTLPAPRPGVVTLEADSARFPRLLWGFTGALDYLLFDAYGEKQWYVRQCEPGKCSWDEPQKRRLRQFFQRDGATPDELYETRYRLRLDRFNPFGSPLVYYYYFAGAYDRLGVDLKRLDVGKAPQDVVSFARGDRG